jgi:hypothetical protein
MGVVLAAFATCVLVAPAHSQQSSSPAADETRRTEAGVIATDNHWSLAEETGDTAYLDEMLLPAYRSVNDDGTAYSKAQILAGAAKRKGTDLATAQNKLAAYRSQHPYGTSVVIHDNTAIASFYDPARGAQKGVKSSDIFVYVDGRWHALYSQHNPAKD